MSHFSVYSEHYPQSSFLVQTLFIPFQQHLYIPVNLTHGTSLCFQTVAQVRGHPKNIIILSQQILGERGKRQHKYAGIIQTLSGYI